MGCDERKLHGQKSSAIMYLSGRFANVSFLVAWKRLAERDDLRALTCVLRVIGLRCFRNGRAKPFAFELAPFDFPLDCARGFGKTGQL
jgi:hypothetical protein